MGCKHSTSGKAAALAAEKKVGQRGAYLSFDDRVHAEWKAGDKNGDGVLSFKEVKRILHKLNVSIPADALEQKFKEHDADGSGSLDFEEFRTLFHATQSMPELENVYKAACAASDGMRADELLRYLTSSSMGKLTFTLGECAELILKHEGAADSEIKSFRKKGKFDEESLLEGPILSYEGFQRLLTDVSFNSLMEPSKYFSVYQDMDQPLSHYYISSSHNTYLTGNQLNSESSGTSLARALKLGVRVVELDAWDGSDGQPIVNHGHTMCKPVPMKECFDAINENAFVSSHYPVIITIENHCSMAQQAVQVEMLKSTFGSKLFHWDGFDDGSGKPDWTRGPAKWASPEQLKGKIVVRDKPIKKKQGERGGPNDEVVMAGGMDDQDIGEAPDNTAKEPVSGVVSLNELEVDDDDEDEDDVESAKALGVDDQLLKVMYIKNVKLRFNQDKVAQHIEYKEPEYASSSSIVEAKMIKLTKAGYPMRDICEYAQRHLVRVYPAGSRVDSSNYDPVPAWNAGCQIVALNYQTGSMPVWLNQGKFSDNGGCGYILKPSFQLPNSHQIWDGLSKQISCEMTVTLMSGHYLPKPLGQSDKSEVIDPYVTITLHGLESDQKRVVSKHVDDNGFNPVWNEKFTFKMHQPELALLSFVVNDRDKYGKDDFIGQRVIPVSAIVPGHRMVQLFHKTNAPQDSFLFVHITFDPSPPQ